MNMNDFTKQEKLLELSKELLAVEEARLSGEKGFSTEELDCFLSGILTDTHHLY